MTGRKKRERAAASGYPARRGRGQWVSGSVVYGAVTLVSDVHGDVTMSGSERPLYRIDNFDLDRPALAVKQARARPSRVLRVNYELVDFAGRQHQLRDLTAWLGGEDRVSVLLVHGTGGQGKSRLARHFARECSREGWLVLSGRHASDLTVTSDGTNQAVDGQTLSTARTLMVVDYAERWPLPDLLTLIEDSTGQGGRRVRILLLARPAGSWWQTLRFRIERMGLNAENMTLPALAEAVERRTMFRDACEQFARALDVAAAGDISPPLGLDQGADSGLVLAIHMAALAVVDAGSRDVQPPCHMDEVSTYLLTRERDHWQHLYDLARVRIAPDAMSHTVYTAALAGPLSYADGLSAFTRAGIGTTEHPHRALRDHALAYPPPEQRSGGNASALQPLYPDRLGEDFLALLTPGHNARYEADPWASEAPSRLLAMETSGDPAPWTGRALATLIETARRWPHVAAEQLYPLLKHQPRLALSMTGAALTALADLSGIEVSVLEQIETVLPRERHADLDTGIAAITSRLAGHRLAGTTDPATRADILLSLGVRLSNAGQHEPALAAAAESAQIYSADPAHRPSLATALENVGIVLTDLGRHEEALNATQQAIAVRLSIAEANPTAHAYHHLAAAYDKLAMKLRHLGRPQDAIAAGTTAIAILRHVAKTNPGGADFDLASSLNNLATGLIDTGRQEEALTATQEAIAIRRSLTAANPPRHELDLAVSLSNLGAVLLLLDRQNEALPPVDESVTIRRRIAAANPTAQPGLAMALGNRGAILKRLGRHEEALSDLDECVAIFRQSAQTNQSAYEPYLARALQMAALARLSLRTELPDALTAAEEAAAIYKRHARLSPARFTARLRSAMNTYADALDTFGRAEEAAVVRAVSGDDGALQNNWLWVRISRLAHPRKGVH